MILATRAPTVLLLGILGFALQCAVASAHPGNTAADGCHYCRTNCDKWGVPWNERHCHGGYTPPSYTSIPKVIDRCSEDGLYQTYFEKKANGEIMEELSAKAWWANCPQTVRKAVYARIYTPAAAQVSTAEKANSCASFGVNALYNELSEECECVNGYVMRDGSCVQPPYCGTNALYSSATGKCECSYGYKKQGKKCVAVSCPANSTYNPTTKKCECGFGYVVKNKKCVLPMTACGFGGFFNSETGSCKCISGYYLKNGECESEPYCGLGGTFNAITETCTCDKNSILKDGTCVYGTLYCGYLEEFNTFTKQCDCRSDYVRLNGKCTSPLDAGNARCRSMDTNASLDYSSKACLCNYGYKADSSHKFCIEKGNNEFPSNSQREIY